MRFIYPLAVLAITHVALSLPGKPQQLNSRQNATAPCAMASSKVAAALQASPSRTPLIEAQLAFECLNSVPLRSAEAVALVDSTRPYVEWQSDLTYLKSPPQDYFFGATDIVSGLDAVKTNITTGVYQSEYAYQVALFQVFNAAHDGHLSFYPDALTKVFSFRRQVPLVSVSMDGVAIPKIYAYADPMASMAPNSTFQASAVTMINDVEASKFIQDTSNQAMPLQDPDAGFNAMLFSRAQLAGIGLTRSFVAGGPFSYIYPGATTKLTFENGTSSTTTNLAAAKTSLTGVVDGDTFYQKFCTGPPAATASTASASPSPTSSNMPSTTSNPAPEVTAPGYPKPVVINSDATISGYYLTDAESSKVAVLSVLSFEPKSPSEFQTVTQNLLLQAKSAGKTKLIIDMSANPGGALFLGYDLFPQMFPQITQIGNSRFRQNTALTKMAEVLSNSIPPDFNAAISTDDELIQISDNFYNFKSPSDLDTNNNTFTSLEAKFPRKQDRGDTFSTLIRRDMTSVLDTTNTTYGLGIEITGYGSRTNFAQPFAAEDMILLYDGFCGSTCTVFSEFMRLQGGVKSIAFGGRPSTTPIQGIGGVKGAASYGWADIYTDAKRTLARQPNLTEDGIPAQFVTEMADCRMFWTPEMIVDVSAVWNAAAKAAWGGGKCVAGGLGLGMSNNGTVAAAVSRNKAVRPVSAVEVKTQVIRSSVELTKDAGWGTRHGKKVVFS